MIENGSFLLGAAQVQPTDIPGCLAQSGTLSPSLITLFLWSLEVNSQGKAVLMSRIAKRSGLARGVDDKGI